LKANPPGTARPNAKGIYGSGPLEPLDGVPNDGAYWLGGGVNKASMALPFDCVDSNAGVEEFGLGTKEPGVGVVPGNSGDLGSVTVLGAVGMVGNPVGGMLLLGDCFDVSVPVVAVVCLESLSD
jgi:hypothetical protein